LKNPESSAGLPGKYFSSKLPNLLIADDNFLLGLTYATGLCKGFEIAPWEFSEPPKGT